MLTAAEPVLIDTNVLVRANIVTAPAHAQARNALERLWAAGVDLWVSRQILREYIAVVSRPQTFAQPLSPTIIIDRVRFFQTHFRVADEGPPVTDRLLSLLKAVPIGGRQVHDANLVATMQVYGISQLLTYNPADFDRFTAYITVLTEQDVAL